MTQHSGIFTFDRTGLSKEEIEKQERLAIIKYEAETYF